MHASELLEVDAAIGDDRLAVDLLEAIREKHRLDGDRFLVRLEVDLDRRLLLASLAVDVGGEVDAALRTEVGPDLLHLRRERLLEIFVERDVGAAEDQLQVEAGVAGFRFALAGDDRRHLGDRGRPGRRACSGRCGR